MNVVEESDFNDNLIEEIRQFDVLFNKKHKRYFDNRYKNKYWNEVATKLNRSVDECKTRWKHLRETFGRKCKPQSTGSSAEDSTWPYFESMSFLKEFIQPRQTRCNEFCQKSSETTEDIYVEQILDEDVSYNSENLFSASTSRPSPAKQRRTIQTSLRLIEDTALAIKEKSISTDNNPDSLICKTIMSLLTEIPEENKDKVRAELFQFVFAAREKYCKKL